LIVEDETAESDKVQPAVGPEFDRGAKFASVGQDFRKEVKQGGFVERTLIAFGVGIAKIPAPEILLLCFVLHG
jgi:hypothetical protein